MSNFTTFLLLNLLNVLIHMDHGIIPAATLAIAKDLHLNHSQLGFLGSVVFLGVVVNGLVAGRVYQLYQTKKVMIWCLIASQITLVLFILTDSFYVAVFARFLTGSFQVFHIVFLPVWIDLHGGENRTIWLTTVQAVIPLGIFLGYLITSIYIEFFHWNVAFVTQIGAIALFVIYLMGKDAASLNIKGSNIDMAGVIDETVGRREKQSYIEMVRIILSSKLYVVAVLSFSFLLFIVTGIQFWITSYFIEVLHTPKLLVNASYVIISLTAPTTGTILGGQVLNRFGGYRSDKSLKVLLIFSILSIIPAVLMNVVSNYWVAGLFLWLLLFNGGALIPGLTGIIMSSVKEEHRSFGNSQAEMAKNLLGYFSAPFLYGLVVSMTGNQSAGLHMLTYATIIPLILILYGNYVVNSKIESLQTHMELPQIGSEADQ